MPDGVDRRLRAGARRGRPGLDRRAGAGHRHDVKARIEEFNALAGHEHVHKGMTSRDLTENVEQLQIRRSLELVFAHGVAVVARLAERAVTYRDLVMAGRSHNVAAQATTLGKRFARRPRRRCSR